MYRSPQHRNRAHHHLANRCSTKIIEFTYYLFCKIIYTYINDIISFKWIVKRHYFLKETEWSEKNEKNLIKILQIQSIEIFFKSYERAPRVGYENQSLRSQKLTLDFLKIPEGLKMDRKSLNRIPGFRLRDSGSGSKIRFSWPFRGALSYG